MAEQTPDVTEAKTNAAEPTVEGADSSAGGRASQGVSSGDASTIGEELLQIALLAAKNATELIRDRRPESLHVGSKSTETDNVTQMDLASEALIRETVLGQRPGDRFIGEESGGDASACTTDPNDATAVTWIVDPIDGTTNYLYDLPGYNISIAASIGGITTAAVVADPTLDRYYSAVRGKGAFCNGRQLNILGDKSSSASAGRRLSNSLLATGFGYSPDLRGRQGRVVADLLPQIRDIRRLGAAALDLCHVAAGHVEGYFEVNLGLWDVAAGALIAAEAGASVGPISGGPSIPGSIVVAHPDIYDELQSALERLSAGTVCATESHDLPDEGSNGRR